MTHDIESEVPLGPPKPARRWDRLAAALALAALVFSIWSLATSRDRAVEAGSQAEAEILQRLANVEASLNGLQKALGEEDPSGRAVNDRLLVVENKDLLFHDTLEAIVEHVRRVEARLDGIADRR